MSNPHPATGQAEGTPRPEPPEPTRTPAARRAIGRALDYLAAPCAWDAGEHAIAAAITDLLHLAWAGTNDDGEGIDPHGVLAPAVRNFEAETWPGGGPARTPACDQDNDAAARRARLVRALNLLDARAAGHPVPSADEHHRHTTGCAGAR